MMLFSLVRMYRTLRARKSVGFAVVLSLVATCVLGNAICFWYFDGAEFGDALWYSIISITTIGYGDLSATSLGARLATVFFIVIMGLSTFSIFLGMTVDWVSDFFYRGSRGLRKVMANNHILIVNFPSASRVKQLIEELRGDEEHRDAEIVIVTDAIETLPFTFDNLLFVSGSPLEFETWERARAEGARMVIILSPSYADSASDAIVASTVTVINNINQDAHVVAECLDEKHLMLFKACSCDAVVLGMKIAGNLLVQEVHDPGVTQMMNVITSNRLGATLYSTAVDEPIDGTYAELAKVLLDRDVNLLCINRGEQSFTQFTEVRPEAGDRVIYIAERRMSWSALMG